MPRSENKKHSFRIFVLIALSISLIFTMLFSVGCKKKTPPVDEPQQPAETPSTPAPEVALSYEAFDCISEYSTYAKGEMLTDSFYFANAWFGEDPTRRNDSLALLSMQLSAAAITNDPNGSGAKALRALGFDGVSFVGFGTDDPDDCAYTYATKKVGEETLVAIVLQSYALDTDTKVKGWKQNFHVNDASASGEHAAFKKAAEKALDGIASLGGENAKYWIMGQSRAGALANLIAAKLSERLTNAEGKIYAYTFETPATVDAALAQKDTAKYAYIHNYLASDDIVPLIPMWGMTRYGKEYEIKSEATELALSDELKKIGSSAADVDFGSNENKIRSLVTYLENRLASDTPSRSDYSKVRRDVYQDENGNPVTIEYDYQTVMKHLMGMIFSGELSGINAENLAENLSVFASSVYSLADAVKGEDTDDAVTVATNYHRAAQGVHNVVNGLIDGAVSLTDIDFYALLRLAGPLMLDATYEAEDDPQFDVAGYIYPTIDLAQSFGNLSYPHHFDAVIARLKTLAPQPKATSFAITLAEPKAEDASSLMPQAFAAGIEGLGMSWLSAKKTGWNTSAETLQSGMLYYLEATIEVVGHLAMDDFKITINGKDPIEMTSGYKDGACLVSFRWEFSVGTPEKVTLHFESGRTSDVTITPAVMLVDRGKMLKYIARPEMEKNVSEEGKKYLFADWKDESGAALDEITAKEDCTLSAHWIQIIDEVALLFNTPVLGGEAKLPSFPEDAPYILSEYHITDEDYKETDLDEVTTRAGEYHLTIFFMAIEGRSVFAEETVTYEEDDWEETVYAGTVLLNGEIYDDSYYESVEGIPFLSVYIAFTVA